MPVVVDSDPTMTNAGCGPAGGADAALNAVSIINFADQTYTADGTSRTPFPLFSCAGQTASGISVTLTGTNNDCTVNGDTIDYTGSSADIAAGMRRCSVFGTVTSCHGGVATMFTQRVIYPLVVGC